MQPILRQILKCRTIEQTKQVSDFKPAASSSSSCMPTAPLSKFSFCAIVAALFGLGICNYTDSVVSVQLQHSSVAISASSLAFSHDPNHDIFRRAAAAASAAASAPAHELLAASDLIFHKAKFAFVGSFLMDNSVSGADIPSYSRKLLPHLNHTQYFVQFSTFTDILTIIAFQKFSGRPIIAHVQDNLYVAIGDAAFAREALLFPGVQWVQARSSSSKLSSALQMHLQHQQHSPDQSATLVAECWLEGCLSASQALASLCASVYLHPTLVEAVCASSALAAAVALLSAHVAIDHVDFKLTTIASNFGGRAILGLGVNASSPASSRVLNEISVVDSVIAVADSGLDVHNCFFYDANITEPPFNNSRVVKFYEVQSCERCGKCCIPGISPPGCNNSMNTCGNYKDESSHGTHVCGTVAGQGPASVEYANGIANGSKIYFQDIENILNNSQCFKPDSCSFAAPTDLINLFAPALSAGA
jgi:hypothetical protein